MLLAVVMYRPWFIVLETSSCGLKTQKKMGGGGRRKMYKFFFPTNFFFQKCSWGSETHANFFFGGGILGVFGEPHAPTGGRAGSEHDTLGGGRIKKIKNKILTKP